MNHNKNWEFTGTVLLYTCPHRGWGWLLRSTTYKELEDFNKAYACEKCNVAFLPERLYNFYKLVYFLNKL